ncbi:hypothetical protein scyTo_0021794, partial [Scyliorhinus torazame]|nr:hypothetical protein [Scyliorhinus torazame]
GINHVLDAREIWMKIFEDYTNSWYWILIGLVIAMAVSLLFILLLRFTAGVLFWFVIFAVIAVIGYVTDIWLMLPTGVVIEFRSLKRVSCGGREFQHVSLNNIAVPYPMYSPSQTEMGFHIDWR